MKTFHTSNYDKAGTNPLAVAISLSTLIPATYKGQICNTLAPDADLLKAYETGAHTDDAFKDLYLHALAGRGMLPAVIADLFADGTVFVCFDYEDGDGQGGDNLKCHRSFLADYLKAYANVTEI